MHPAAGLIRAGIHLTLCPSICPPSPTSFSRDSSVYFKYSFQAWALTRPSHWLEEPLDSLVPYSGADSLRLGQNHVHALWTHPEIVCLPVFMQACKTGRYIASTRGPWPLSCSVVMHLRHCGATGIITALPLGFLHDDVVRGHVVRNWTV